MLIEIYSNNQSYIADVQKKKTQALLDISGDQLFAHTSNFGKIVWSPLQDLRKK